MIAQVSEVNPKRLVYPRKYINIISRLRGVFFILLESTLKTHYNRPMNCMLVLFNEAIALS